MASTLDPSRHDPAPPLIEAAALGAFVDALVPHEVRLLAGLDAAALAEGLALAPPPRRPVLRLDLAGPGDAAARIERAIDQLARAVAGLWPYLWSGEDFSYARDDALFHTHLPLRLAGLAARTPALSAAWAREVVPRLLRGEAPRLREPTPAVEWAQLALAFAPQGMVLAVSLNVDAEAHGFVAAVEWLARHAEASALVLAPAMPTDRALERILYGARATAGRLPTSFSRDPNDMPETVTDDRVAVPEVIALPETEGQAHPQSAVELKLFTLIQADADLRPLFGFNLTVPGLPLLAAKADVIWREGRLVVEIDGPEHRGATKYRADRRRDATLLLAGWRVLRFTNEDIITDAALALATIREAVRLVEGERR